MSVTEINPQTIAGTPLSITAATRKAPTSRSVTRGEDPTAACLEIPAGQASRSAAALHLPRWNGW